MEDLNNIGINDHTLFYSGAAYLEKLVEETFQIFASLENQKGTHGESQSHLCS